jgi:hypothetical protein
MTMVLWICCLVTIVSAIVSFGYALAELQAATNPHRLPSAYALARSASLLLVAAVAPFTANVGFVAAAALAMIGVQLLDAVIGGRSRDPLKTIGPAVTGVANAIAVVWMLTS